jgi:hypothetical protein
MEYLSFQTPAFVGVGVLGGQVGLADEGQVEACIGEGLDHAGAVGDQADADLVEDPRVQFVATSGAGRGFDGVADLLGALQLHWVGPSTLTPGCLPFSVNSRRLRCSVNLTPPCYLTLSYLPHGPDLSLSTAY